MKPKKERPLKSRASTEALLVKLLAAIKATYPLALGACMSPGLVLSDLEDGQQYGSICSYEHGAKNVRYKSKQPTIREVLIDLSRQLVGAEMSTARQELAKAVK